MWKGTSTWACWTAVFGMGLVACGGEEASAPRSSPIGKPIAVEPVDRDLEPRGGEAMNEAPEIVSVHLFPDDPVSGDTLQALVDARDPDGDQAALFYSWWVDGVRQSSTSSTFELASAERGTEVELAVVARDAFGESEPVVARIVVGNQPPVVTAAQLEPQVVRGDVDLAVHPRAVDPDGDSLRYEYRWWINEQERDERGPVLSADAFGRGDRIEVEVVASDGHAESRPLRSDPIEVQNAPPQITSLPGDFGADGTYRYALEVDDPDDERGFRYRLLEGPPGMALDPSNGVVSWRPREDQAGDYAVKLEVSDRHGANAVQSFELRLSFQPVASNN